MLKKLSNAIEAYVNGVNGTDNNIYLIEYHKLNESNKLIEDEIINQLTLAIINGEVRKLKISNSVEVTFQPNAADIYGVYVFVVEEYSYEVSLTKNLVSGHTINIERHKSFCENVNIDDAIHPKIVKLLIQYYYNKDKMVELYHNNLERFVNSIDVNDELINNIKSIYEECVGKGDITPIYKDFAFTNDAYKRCGRYVFENKTNFKKAQTVIVSNGSHYMITEELNPRCDSSVVFVSKIDVPTIEGELNALELLVNNDNVSKTQLLHQIHNIRCKFNNNGIYYVE